MTPRMGKTKWTHSSYLEVCGLSPSFWHAVFDLATSLLAICPKGTVKVYQRLLHTDVHHL